MINANSVKVGNIINFKNRLCSVLRLQHTQPGKGGAYVQMELKDIIAGTKYNERFRSEEKLEKVRLDETSMQYLYKDGSDYVLMNIKTYEQVTVGADVVGDKEKFLTDDLIITAVTYDENIIDIELPDSLEVEVESTESVVKGQTSSASFKPAILTNSVRVMVPAFISDGDKIIIKSLDLGYVERVKS
jgi:elongation factor P